MLKNTGILLIARMSTQAVSFFLLPLYTAILTTKEYGQIDLYATLAMIVIPLLTLQVEMALFRFLITETDPLKQKEIASTTFITVCLVVFTASALYFVASGIIRLNYFWLVLTYYIAQSFSALFVQYCRAFGDNIGYGIASVLSSGISILLNVLFVAALKMGVSGVLLSTTIAHIIATMFAIIRSKATQLIELKKFSLERCKQLLHYSIPLVFNQIASWAINYSNRIIIIAYLGMAVNGIYSVANKFPGIIASFLGVYNLAWTESVVKSLRDQDGITYVSKAIEASIVLFSSFTTLVMGVLPIAFRIMINLKFLDSYQHIPFLLIAILFSGIAATIGSLYIAHGRTKEVSITTILSGVISVILHFLLLKRFGLYAASVSSLISFLALALFRIHYLKAIVRLKLKFDLIISQFVVMLITWVGYALRYQGLALIVSCLSLVIATMVLRRNGITPTSFFRKGNSG